MNTKPENPKARLIFALDVPALDKAVPLIKTLNGSVGCFKIGLELFIAEGPPILQAVRDHSDAEIFLDLKLHDIPATVQRAVERAKTYAVKFLTVHCGGGDAMLQAAVESAGTDLQILGVTVLTSIRSNDLDPGWGYNDGLTVAELVMARFGQARAAGCTGFVCSGEEVAQIKKQSSGTVTTVVPGIRPEWSDVGNDDQNRIVTPAEAIQNGADYIVVGRPIRDARDPKDAAQKITDEIASATLGGNK